MPKHLKEDLCFWWHWTLSQEHLSDLSGGERFCNLTSEGYDIDPENQMSLERETQKSFSY
jgi:hypothetical protein